MKTEKRARRKAEKKAGGPSSRKTTVHFEFTDAAARKVYLAGTFNNWRPENGEMMRLAGGKWVKKMSLAPGTYEYRLVVDGHWKTDPNADHTILNPFGERNSLVTVST